MTNKRFEYKNHKVYDNLTGETHSSNMVSVNVLNELYEENQIKLEIVDAFIHGLEDEKRIDSENVEFQCKMNFTIKILEKLKKDMLNPTDFKRGVVRND